jgi:hypothetical protein
LSHKKCECGCGETIPENRRFVTHHNLRKHGLCGTPEHNAWSQMIDRCESSSPMMLAYYRNRGIAVCQRWRESFLNFLSDMGPQPHGTTLDRIDGTRGYEPGNCLWASWEKQNNNRLTCRRIEAFGESKTAAQWSRDLRAKAKAATIYARFFLYQWSAQEAIETPARKIAAVKDRWWKRGRSRRTSLFDRSQS